MLGRVLTMCAIVAGALAVLAGCGAPQPTIPATITAIARPTGTPATLPTVAHSLTATPTMMPTAMPSPTTTPTALRLPAGVTQTPTPSEPVRGEVEIRIPYHIADGTRSMVEGKGGIDCHFVSTGEPITIHVLLQFEAVLAGELLPPSPRNPSGWLDAYLMIDGAITQYYRDYPQQAQNPCPEDDPCRTPAKDVIPLPFDYEEGSSVTEPWTFILHLEPASG